MDIADLQWWGWLLLIVVGLSLFVVMPIWLFWIGRRPKIPDGVRYESRWGGYGVTCVFQTEDGENVESSRKRIAKCCARALWATSQAWSRAGRALDSDMEQIVVLIRPPALFESSPFPSIRKAAAFAVYTGAGVGAGWPMVVVRAEPRILAQIMSRGEPVIHECIHLYLGETSEPDKDRNHDAPGAWGEGGIQGRAQSFFSTGL